MNVLRPGDLVADRYRIETVLAKGGMGAVYLATDERIGRSVALKVLLSALSDDATSITRFEREARATAQLHHPGIVAMLDFGTTPDGLAFLVMEHLAGETLASVLDGGPVAPARAVDIVVQALGALSVAHAAGVVHRDLKPGNLMLVPLENGHELVKVLDFGLAQVKSGEAYTRLTQTGAIVGTPLFMSPEQSRGEPCDPRTDVYAMGMVLWCCLTGVKPFDTSDLAALVVAVQSEVPRRADQVRPEVPSALATIAQKALEKRPEDRHASANELGAALSMAKPSPSLVPPAVASVPPAAAIASPPALVLSAPPLPIAPAPTASAPVAAAVPSPWPRMLGCALALVLGVGAAALALAGLGYVFYERVETSTVTPVVPPTAAPAPPPPMLPSSGGVAPNGEPNQPNDPCGRAFTCCRAYWDRVEPMDETCTDIVGRSGDDAVRCEEQLDGWSQTALERGVSLPECQLPHSPEQQ